MQYRTSFFVAVLGQLLATVIEFGAVWMLFERFGSLGEWSLAQVGVFYGVAHLALGWADMLSSGWDYAGTLIRQGTLDRVLVRPRTTALQMLGHELALRRLGRLSQGAVVLVWALGEIGGDLGLAGYVVLAGAVFGGGCLFLGLFVLRGTLAIWTVETLELVNATTYGGVQAAQYPMSIYEDWLRRFFTYVVPLVAVLYLPVAAALGGDPLGAAPWVGALTWLIGPAFLAVSIVVWNRGVRHYASTGS
jgi:ABC-2 type transport system permease protein